jgi:hypothetical protein
MTSNGSAIAGRGVLRAATVITIVIAVALLLWRPLVALGFVGGVVTGAGMLSALVFVLNRLVVTPGERRGARWPYLLLHAAKLGMAIAFAFFVIIVWRGNVIAFAAGYTAALVALLIYQGIPAGVGANPDAPDGD